MMSQSFSPDQLHHILDGLKDFQRQTVEYVFQRLYTAPDATRRFLIADEVGLGKTLVARGVIARTLEYLWNTGRRLDVVYICSNADIARQNINRLNLTGQPDFALASRITLLPTQIQNLQNNRVNFISFTPSTSFDLKSGMGRGEERVLLYWLLRQAWGFNNASALNVLQGDMGSQRFRNRIYYFDRKSIEPTLAGKFIDELASHPHLHKGFDDLCDIYKRADSIIPYQIRQKRAKWIGEVRELLARSCLTALEPDLIILDEFQRFKHLLNDESEDSELARHLFNYSDEHDAARVLLLSATPYKMYTLSHEDSEDHYQDFVQTLKFLFDDPVQTRQLEKLISDYRQEIFRLREGDVSPLRTIKAELETSLRRVMVRTERLAASTDRDGMLVHVPPAFLLLKPDDLHAYLGLAKIAELIEQPTPLEYWKSVPYLFNFMDEYQFKTEFKSALENPDLASSIVEILRAYPQLLLSIKDIENYTQLDPGNARLRSLLADTVGAGVWRALWLPPAIPYYKLEGVFSDPALARFTKRLVFSAWRAVPKAISIFLSYESERLMFQAFNKEAKNTKKARQRRRPLLRFAQSEGRLTGLPVLGLIYPCEVFARSLDFDPLRLGANLSNGGLPTLDTLLAQAEKRISELLSALPLSTISTGVEDERWYWAAPILLDAQTFPDFTRDWWQLDQGSSLAEEWAGSDNNSNDYDGEEVDTYWGKHIEEVQNLLREYFSAKLQLGRTPADLPRVLAQIALSGLGVVSLRALLRVTGEPDSSSDIKHITTNSARIAKSFLFLFNLPESIAFIRSLNRAEPYWRRVLEYSTAGGLQAVMDEYLHMLHESLGLQDLSPGPIAEALAEHFCDVVTFRTSTPNVDNIQLESPTPITGYGMRGRFAMRFGDEKSESGAEPTRADRVRAAFNSPFWPFVLATTSIGQEGLDFHNYCHAVVHWNLPTNPVDLEQREGRVHRYKGHAVRKNLAHSYSLPELVSFMKSETDVWKVLFQSARMNQTGNANDISPFWVYPLEGGAKIERHVPAMPLSRDQLNLEALQRSLTVYRMVFGQNRQEDLLAYLVAHFPAEKLTVLMEELRVDLSPPLK
jgi:hypothetical protein